LVLSNELGFGEGENHTLGEVAMPGPNKASGSAVKEKPGSTGQMNRGRIRQFLLSNNRALVICLILLAVVIFTVQYFIFLNYITDDAGITFGSAKTLIDHGRWSIDRFAERVEAYSTPLWMWLLAGAYALRVPIPVAAKVMTYIFCVMALIACYLINSRYGNKARGWTNAFSPLILAVMTGFLVWGASGLENGLYAFLTAGLLYGCLEFDKSAKPLLLTLFAFLMSVVRPEGILFAAVAYFALFISLLLNRRKEFRRFSISVSAFAVLYALFLLWGYQVFAWFVPNTYYAKVSSSIFWNFSHGGYYTIVFLKDYSTLFIFGIVLLFLAAIYGRGGIRRNRNENQGYSWLAGSNRVIWYSTILALANLVYVLYVGGAFFGRDRFFTPLLVCLAVISAELFKNANLFPAPELEQPAEQQFKRKHKLELKKKPEKKRGYLVARAVVVMVLVLFVLQMGDGTAREHQSPWVPFQHVKSGHVDFGNQAGEYLISNGYLPNAKHVAYMVPDIGATSYYAENYTIIDSAKLGNVPIAHNKYRPVFFKEYVFNVVRPVLIETHGSWSYVSAIGRYQEFTDHYNLVSGSGVDSYRNMSVPSGYYVLKDLFISNNNSVVRTSGGNLVLTRYNINALQFTVDGEIQMETGWQRTVSPVDSAVLDNHLLSVYLQNSQGRFQLDQYKIAGGYYLPGKWDTKSEIVDRRAISLKNVPVGSYKIVVGITYPGQEMDTLTSFDIQVVANSQEAVAPLVKDFNDSLSRNDDSVVGIALGKIKAIDLAAFRTSYNIYIDNRLGLTEGLLNGGQPLEAYQTLYPLAGSETGDAKLDVYLKKVAIEVSRALQKEGQQIESQGDKSRAINVYEKSMWLDPDNSHLRRHIEAIRAGG
jgi:hypothetical protein